MNSPLATKPEIQNENSDSQVLVDVRDVSKIYHLWESPRARLIYGLWSQVPSWAPEGLIRRALDRKRTLGHDFYALQGISLELRRGESVAIMGRNGSGKSTLLQIICGTLQPSAGTVSRHCHRIAALLELGSGFNPEFTGRENVYLNGAVLGLAKAEIDAKFDQILEFAEIDQFIDQPVKTYSSGMMVRLAFAVQVQLDPELLIVDEALAVGDVFFQQKCFAYMRRLKERGCSFLIVSHDVTAIQHFCDRGIVLVQGRKHFEGISRDAIREYHLTVSAPRNMNTNFRESAPVEQAPEERSEFEEPERWFEPTDAPGNAAAPAKLIRWSCADASGKVVDHFFPNQKIRLFVEFECKVSISDASAAFAIRDRTGQMIHGKHQYQIGLGTRIRIEPTSSLRCEFSFACHLTPGDYTVEFGLVDIAIPPAEGDDAKVKAIPNNFFVILCQTAPVGRFVVTPEVFDPIRRTGHFGIVDVEAATYFRTSKTKT
jgi:lipopolysaccharide transport system ATP-binding protein